MSLARLSSTRPLANYRGNSSIRGVADAMVRSWPIPMSEFRALRSSGARALAPLRGRQRSSRLSASLIAKALLVQVYLPDDIPSRRCLLLGG